MSIELSTCPLAQNVRAKVNPRVADIRPSILGAHFIPYTRVFPRRRVSIKVSACPPSQNDKPEVSRRTANFRSSIWGDHFINYIPDDKITRAYKEQQVEDLKEEVRRGIMAAAGNPSQQLNYIDAVQRLGLGYHFEREIEEALQHIYDSSQDGDDKDDDLYNVALQFRLLRQQGFNISSDIFRRFKDEKGNFKESLNSDVGGILGLYEASHLRVWEEDILDEALVFTTNHLKSMVEHLEYPLAAQVTHALKQPIRKGLNRLEARWYMSIYQDEASHDKALLKLAKLDFNLLQSLHKEELSNIARWWKELDFATKLPFARDRLVELYFCVLGIFFEPRYLGTRRIPTLILAMATILDDIYDAYGTFEELKLFTKAIERWDANSIDQLPEYMQIFYMALLDIYKEFEQEMDREGKAYCVHYAKEAMKIQVRAYFDEAKWFHEGYVPTLEEYMGVAAITSGFSMLTTISFMAMGEIITKELFDWVFNDPFIKASSVILRLMDDMASYKFEQERGHVASSIECFMKQYGVSEQQANDEFQKQVVNAWKDINKGCLRPTPIRMPLLMCVLNLARLADLNYKEKDDYTHVGKLMKENIASLLIDPVIVSANEVDPSFY